MIDLLTDNKLDKYNVVLASQSPRRQELLKNMGIDFEVIIQNSPEVFPESLYKEEIALFLAENKASAFISKDIKKDTLIITADTIVWYKDKVLNKPKDSHEAYEMIKMLSGNEHNVITGVCIKSSSKQICFYNDTKVFFRDICEEEIHYYINNYKPYDKAGAYGIQEWIGIVGVERIEGSYFNVMGLPTQQLYLELHKFIKE